MEKIITFDDCYQMTNHFSEGDFEQIEISHGWVLQSFDYVFVVLLMGTQNQDWHWSVTLSEIDGPMYYYHGTVSCRGLPEDESRTQLEREVNEVFLQLTKNWLWEDTSNQIET